IERKTSIPYSEVNAWLAGTNIPRSIYRLDPASKSNDLQPGDIPKSESTSLAYLLGARAAITTTKSRTASFVFSHTDDDVAAKAGSAVKTVFKRDATVGDHELGGAVYHKVSSYSRLLGRHIDHVTQNNTRIPWEHLVSREERLAFINGFLDFTGSITHRLLKMKGGDVKYPLLHVEKLGNEGFIKDFAVLLKDVGVLSVVNGDTLRIQGRRDLEKLRGYDIFTSKKTQEKLDGLLAQPFERPSYPPEKYREVMNYCEQHHGAKPAEISKATGVSWVCARDWSRGLKKPESVKRLEELQKIEGEMPDRDVIGYLYRLGAGSMLARTIAGVQKDVNKVREKCAALEQGGVKGAELESRLTQIFGTPPEGTAEAGGQRPPYADYLDVLVGKWDEFNDPLRMMEISIGLTASRHKAKGATPAEVRGHLLDAVKKKRPQDYDTLAAYLSTEGEAE
ncbi:MAG: hypothetical protein PHG85_07525, partial [Candidatus Altiarchaeota archaeon]|nr:hypothetical protein [Candidatus Altiarchaeota archaeon]